jgi:carotenoid cleavage dioxygenase-like enzyme
MSELQQKQLENQILDNSAPTLPSRFPQTIVAVSRKEFEEPIQLTVRDGQTGLETKLSDDLHGHFFLVGPAGSIKSTPVEGDDSGNTVWVAKDGWTPLYNGDGMIYRFSFANGGATLKTRLVKPPCYYADLATAAQENCDRFEGLGFQNLGIARTSLNKLGMRNQLNTAFLPFKLPNDKSDRLLVTWDMGRPYEIDPETLETLTPVGKNQDWSDLLPKQPPQPFKQVMSSAHPVFDPHTGELFTVNVGKSVWTMLALSRSLTERVAENAASLKTAIDDSAFAQSIQGNLIKLYGLLLWLIQIVVGILGKIEKISQRFGGYDFVHLLLWDGKQVDIARKWNVLLSGNRPLKIDQTVHQMGLTKNYVIFAETSFKFSLENILPYQTNVLATDFKILLADFIDYPQYPTTKLYIVKREDLKQAKAKTNKLSNFFSRSHFKNLPTVVAKSVEIQPEFSHYLVDYDDSNEQITLYVDHLAATDVAEYIRIFDRSAFDDRDRDDLEDRYDDSELTYRLQKLAGNIVSPMDISRLGYWVIDANTAKVITHKLVSEPKLTWSTAFYIWNDKRPTQKFTDIFWNSWGCWPDTLTTRAVEAYKRYPAREIPLDKVLELTYQGIPSSLCHLKIERETINNQADIDLKITENSYQFDRNSLGTSAQFIPRPDAQNQTDGHIICVVLTSDNFLSQSNYENNDPNWSQNTEIWIFDARNLNQGPVYKLSHPLLNIGFTIHATWLKEANSPSRINYDLKEDYEYLVEQSIKNKSPKLGLKIRELFEQEIYPKF